MPQKLIRKINGKVYRSDGKLLTRAEAQKIAKRFRERDVPARVLRRTTGKHKLIVGYSVYIWPYKIKRVTPKRRRK